MDAKLNNLPIQLSTFIGREREITEVKRLLSTARLVTLTGAGGCGKTRLATEVARGLVEPYADGVWFVDLAPLSDPSLVPQRLTSTLDAPEQPGQPLLTTLTNYLRDKHTLLVLDNCEHLMMACAQLTETLLQSCLQVRILATSRAALRVSGQMIFLVPSLSAPPGDTSLADLQKYEAVQLFVARATEVQPTFALNEQNAAAVAQICSQLDGIPLALELAAARAKMLTATQIAARLNDALVILTRGSPSAPPRQQTLRATMDWSYALLTEPEQILFHRLAVFAGGFTLDAAEAVCAVQGIGKAQVLDVLSDLVDKSLAFVQQQGQSDVARYDLLEPVRQYAREKLEASGEVEQVCLRHLNFFVDRAEQAEPLLSTGQRTGQMMCLRVEHDNLRAALAWACTCEPERACWLAGLLRWFWHLSEHDDEAHTWYGRVLGLARPQTPTRGLALALLGAGMIAGLLLDLEAAQALLKQSMEAWQALDDRPRLAETLYHLARARVMLGHAEDACVIFESHEALIRQYADPMILANILTWWGRVLATTRRDYAGAMVLHEQSLTIGRSIADPITLGMTYRFMGFCAIEQADYEAAKRFNQEALTWRRRAGTRLVAHSLLHSADVACLQGHYAQAQALYDEALAGYRAMGIQGWVAHVLARLGYLALHQGDIAQAVTYLTEGLAICRERGDRAGIARCLAGYAELQRQQVHLEQSVGLLACDALHLLLQDVRGPVDRIEYERTVASARAQLDDVAFAKARAEGRALTLEQALAAASAALTRLAEAGSALPATVRVESGREEIPELRIFGLGGARVYRGAQLLTTGDWTYTKSKELLFYLLCNPSATRGAIGLELWPDVSASQLRNQFHVTTHHLRRALGDRDWLTLNDGRYAFNRSRQYWFDVEAFESHLAQAQSLLRSSAEEPQQAVLDLREAARLYQGDFVPEFTDSDWSLLRREELRRKHFEALLTLGRLLFGAQQYGEAADVYQRAVALDNYLELAHRELMRCYARQGERGQALRHYGMLVSLMRDDLGSAPAAETTVLFERIRQGEAP